jgi:hypothetical protein
VRVTKGYLGCSTQSDYPGLLNLEGEGWGNEICFGGIQHRNLDPTTSWGLFWEVLVGLTGATP